MTSCDQYCRYECQLKSDNCSLITTDLILKNTTKLSQTFQDFIIRSQYNPLLSQLLYESQ